MKKSDLHANSVLGKAFGPLAATPNGVKKEGFDLSGNLQKDKKRLSAYVIGQSLRRKQSVNLTDNNRLGTANPSRKTHLMINALCSPLQPLLTQVSSGREGFGWVDVRWLPRYAALCTVTEPVEITGRSGIMGCVEELLNGESGVMLTGFDSTIPWNERGWCWLWAVGNGIKSDQLATTLSEAMEGCKLMGLHFEHPQVQSVYAYLQIPLTMQELANSPYGFLLDEGYFLDSLEVLNNSSEESLSMGLKNTK